MNVNSRRWQTAGMAPAPGEPDERPSLEMPSFSLRRRRRAAAGPVAEVGPTPEPAPEPTPELAPEPTRGEPDVGAPRSRRELPPLTGLPAAALTGVVVGALAVALAWLAAAGCEAVRGTSACGGAIGFPTLVVGLVLLAWVGGTLLRAFGVADAFSTSVLAVGVLAVLVMVFLLGSLDEAWSAVAVLAFALVAHVGSWWVTTSVASTDDDANATADAREPYDVR